MPEVALTSLHLAGMRPLGEPLSLREQVAHSVRAALIGGELRPGTVYSAPALAARFGVSATPVREALLDLAKEGLVEAVRNKGFRVTVLSERDLDEIYALRVMLEVPAVGQVARSAHATEARALRPLALAIEQEAGSRDAPPDLVAYLEADRRFHLALLGLLGQRRLVAMVGSLRSQARLYGLAELAERGQLVRSAREHRRLLQLVVRGDGDAAEELMRRHLGHTRGIWAQPGGKRE